MADSSSTQLQLRTLTFSTLERATQHHNSSSPRIPTQRPVSVLLYNMTAIKDSPGLILVADSSLGVAWERESSVLTLASTRNPIQDPLFAKTADLPHEINGFHALDGMFYFTDSAMRLYGKVGITNKGTATGPAVKILNDVPGGNHLRWFCTR